MKFGYELMLWSGAGLCLLYIFFGWPPIIQPLVHSVVAFLLHT